MRRASKVVAVAEAVREESIDRFGMSPNDVVMVPNAADPGRLAPTLGRVAIRESLGIPAVAPVVLSVGALTWEKDPFNHLEVGSRVLAAVPDAIHIFVGDGPMREAMRRRVAQIGSQERTMFLGSRADMGDVLAAADVVLFASRSDGMEGMPAVVIEGGMSGLPVAALAVAGVSEVVVDGQTGLLAPPGDTDLLAQAPGTSRCGPRSASTTWCGCGDTLSSPVLDRRDRTSIPRHICGSGRPSGRA